MDQAVFKKYSFHVIISGKASRVVGAQPIAVSLTPSQGHPYKSILVFFF